MKNYQPQKPNTCQEWRNLSTQLALIEITTQPSFFKKKDAFEIMLQVAEEFASGQLQEEGLKDRRDRLVEEKGLDKKEA